MVVPGGCIRVMRRWGLRSRIQQRMWWVVLRVRVRVNRMCTARQATRMVTLLEQRAVREVLAARSGRMGLSGAGPTVLRV